MTGMFMVRCSLDTRRLMHLSQRQRHDDLGYLVHTVLTGLFGDAAPKPFAITTHLAMGQVAGGRVNVLGYAQTDALQDRAREIALPEHYATVDWDSFATKPMATEFAPGRRLGFEVRVCPTVRKASDGPHHRAGAEVDAFVSSAWDVPRSEPVDRTVVYRDWLVRRFGAAAIAEDVTLTRFVLAPAFRRGRSNGQNRPGTQARRPDATLRGVLTVRDAALFTGLLKRGIGRHRSFGFGMLLLRANS